MAHTEDELQTDSALWRTRKMNELICKLIQAQLAQLVCKLIQALTKYMGLLREVHFVPSDARTESEVHDVRIEPDKYNTAPSFQHIV